MPLPRRRGDDDPPASTILAEAERETRGAGGGAGELREFREMPFWISREFISYVFVGLVVLLIVSAIAGFFPGVLASIILMPLSIVIWLMIASAYRATWLWRIELSRPTSLGMLLDYVITNTVSGIVERLYRVGLVERFVEDLYRSMGYGYTLSLLSSSVLASMPLITVSVMAVAGILYVIGVDVFYIIVLVALGLGSPLAVIAVYNFAKYARIHSRAANIEGELPFIAAFIASLAASGLSLASIARLAGHLKYLPWFRREISFLQRIARLRGKSLIDAAEEVMEYHPSLAFKQFLLSLTTMERIGGERLSAVKTLLENHVAVLQDRVESMLDKFTLYSNLMLMMFVLLPLGILTIGILASGAVGASELAQATIWFPALSAIALIFVVEATIVSEVYEQLPRKTWLVGVAAIMAITAYLVFSILALSYPDIPLFKAYSDTLDGASSTLLLWLGINPELVDPRAYIMVALVVILASTPLALYMVHYFSKVDEISSSVPIVAKAVVEQARIGNPPKRAIMNIVSYKLAPAAKQVFDIIAARLRLGAHLNTVLEKIPGIIVPLSVKRLFEVLHVAEMVGIEHSSLSILADFLAKVEGVKLRVRKQARSFISAGLISIVLLAVALVLIKAAFIDQLGQLAQIFTELQRSGASMPFMQFTIKPLKPAEKAVLLNTVYTGVILDAFLVGIITGKALRNTVTAGLVYGIFFTVTALITLIVMSINVSILLGFVF